MARIKAALSSEAMRNTDQRRAAGCSQASGRGSSDFPALLVRAVDEGNRQIRVLASSGSLDRHGERILPTAFKDSIDVFMRNGVVLACHQHRLADGEPPVIGSVVRLWVDKEGLWAIIKFAETELAEQYWQLYRSGHMKAVSVGFMPLEWTDSDEEGARVRTYTKVELLEISCVAVPSNRDALVRSARGGNSWLDQKRAEKAEEKEFRAALAEAGKTVEEFDVDCDEFVRLILGLDDEEEIEGDGDLDFSEEVNCAEAPADQFVAGLSPDCNLFVRALHGEA
jgi:HK97 family phage prohead protease